MDKKFILLICSVIILFLYGTWHFSNAALYASRKSDDTEINGLIEKINYDEKGYPNILVNDSVFYIPESGLRGIFQIGDSIWKKKNCNDTRQYRKGNFINSYHNVFHK